MHLQLPEAYRPRPIRCTGIWEVDGWRLKLYEIAYQRESPRPSLVEAAQRVARERLPQPAVGDGRYGVGFVGAHDGRAGCVAFVDWWADGEDLHHHLYVSPVDAPVALLPAKPTDLTACTWDLAVLCFERQAWLEAVLNNPDGPDLDRYLQTQLNGDV
jgi:hypothetical protein